MKLKKRISFLPAGATMLCVVLVSGLLRATAAPAGNEPALEDLQARVDRTARELERLRGRKLKRPVPVKLQGEADFRAYVTREVNHQLPDDLAVKESLALQAFGLLPPGYDLKKGITDLYVSQAGAYYDPKTDTFYVLKTHLPDAQFTTLVLHELAHAMQDQYFDLDAMREEALKNPNEDAKATLAYVYEGEASYIMMLGQLLQGDKRIDDIPLAQQEMMFQSMRDMSRDALLASALANQPAAAGENDVRKAVQALEKVPGYMFWGLQDPYLKGQYCIHRVRVAQGWDGVDALFKNPPTSTEQVLHPEKLVDPREEPKTVTLPDLSGALGDGWSEVYRNTLGEAGVVTFFDTHNPVAKVQAAAGWGGDSYAVFQSPSEGLLLFWETVWDETKDADEFEKALRAVNPTKLCAGRTGTTMLVKKVDTKVTVIAGPPAAARKLLDATTPPPHAP